MLEIRNLGKSYHNLPSLQNVNLKLAEGEFFSLLGPSGCGKTTLLRILAGFETPDEGEIFWKGRSILELSPQKRPFHMVFQNHALFPHLSVGENIAFGLRPQKLSKAEVQDRVHEMLELVRLQGFENRRPQTLSGGQSQRVAVARALAPRPEILLLDEPLSALDLQMREHLQKELRWIQKKLKLTFVFVTHDQEEALLLSDRIAVLEKGKIQQVSEPFELYSHPSTAFAAGFVGSHCHFIGEKISATSSRSGDIVKIKVSSGEILAGKWCGETKAEVETGAGAGPGVGNSSQVQAFLRPEKWQRRSEVASNRLRVQIFHRIFKGAFWELQVQLCRREERTTLNSESDSKTNSIACSNTRSNTSSNTNLEFHKILWRPEWGEVPAPGEELDFYFLPSDLLVFSRTHEN